MQSTKLIVQECDDYVSNSLPPFKKLQKERLLQFKSLVEGYLSDIIVVLNAQEFQGIAKIMEKKEQLFTELENLIDGQINGFKSEQFGLRNSMLFFSLQLETKDLIAVAASFVDLFSKMQKKSLRDKKLPSEKVT